MPSSPLGRTTIERRWACHDITSLGQHTRLNDVGCVMTSPPLDSTHSRQCRACHDITALGQHTRSATSGVACHHRPWTTHTVGRRRAWHDITTLGLDARSDDVGRGMTSPPLDSRHGRTKFGMSCHHCLSTAHTVGRRLAWHAIIALGKHTQSDDIGRGRPSSPL